MWRFLAAPFLAAAALLVAAGVPKLGDPGSLVRAIRSVGLPATRASARAVAGAEVVVGLWALARPGALSAGLVAAAYGVFTAFVLVALSRGGVLGSCGCFGKPDTPPTRTHAAITTGLALVAAGVAAAPPAEGWLGTPLAWTVGVTGTGALVAFLLWIALAVLPTVTPAAVRSTRRG